jgi:hypothetical protein
MRCRLVFVVADIGRVIALGSIPIVVAFGVVSSMPCLSMVGHLAEDHSQTTLPHRPSTTTGMPRSWRNKPGLVGLGMSSLERYSQAVKK